MTGDAAALELEGTPGGRRDRGRTPAQPPGAQALAGFDDRLLLGRAGVAEGREGVVETHMLWAEGGDDQEGADHQQHSRDHHQQRGHGSGLRIRSRFRARVMRRMIHTDKA